MKKSSEKSFGILFYTIFFLIAIWFFLEDCKIIFWALALAFIFLFVAFLKKELLKPLNIAWIKLGEILGKILP